ncbi:NUDIX hydrolase [Halorubellus sp. PRR65]|uniref:NUDIX hydrolase n=1 Tax=Halorubellus sp. PRR65 TaxID=3098148 RepID=UPI002B25E656|nr:NUDIX hydrolase [Halorubellus sp. PRR65]
MTDGVPTPPRETAYDVDVLREAYGPFPAYDRTYEKGDASALVEAKGRDALGGAAVVVRRERDGAVLYADVREDDADWAVAAWDVPGGGREPGERPETTAVREVHEEVGLAVDPVDVLAAYRLTFDDGDRAVTGVWVRFLATVADPRALDVQHEELARVAWRTDRPADVDDLLALALDELDDH